MTNKKDKVQIVFLGLPKKKQEELRKKIFKEIAKRTTEKGNE
jgi:hypothetical protein